MLISVMAHAHPELKVGLVTGVTSSLVLLGGRDDVAGGGGRG